MVSTNTTAAQWTTSIERGLQSGIERLNLLVRIGELVAITPQSQTGVRHASVNFPSGTETGIFIATDATLTPRTNKVTGSSVVVLTFGQTAFTKMIIGTIQIVP